MLKKFTKSNEGVIALLIVLIVLVFSVMSSEFRTVNTLFNMTRAMFVTSILAISSLLIFIVGGLDLSFMAIASFAMYVVVHVFTKVAPDAPIILMFLFGIGIGALLGLVNSFFVIITKMPIFIVTLATEFMFGGACLAFVGTSKLEVPQAMVEFSRANIITATDIRGNTIGINVAILFVIALYVIMFIVLKYTRFGRTLYAIGGDIDAAKRVGINVSKNIVAVFVLSGAIASVAGVMNAALLRLAVPGDLIGGELIVIAAVILGGAKNAEGKGTILGTILGVILIIVISNSLNLLRVPSYWQEAVLGAVIILGTIFSTLSSRKKKLIKATA
jgi:simple sugar transport system permease protein